MKNSDDQEEYTDASESDKDYGHDEVFESNQRPGVVEDLKKLVSSNPSITISMVHSSHPHSVPYTSTSLPGSTSSIGITEVLPSLPSPVACTRSLLQEKFPHLRLPSSHPSHLLEPVTSFQPKPVLLSSLTSISLSHFAQRSSPDWTVWYVVPSIKIGCLAQKFDFLVIVLDLGGSFKICIKNGQINTTKYQKILKLY